MQAPVSNLGNTILLVEDDAAIAETLGMFLSYEGYSVLRAGTVDSALTILSEQKPDLLLLDYMLDDCTAEPVADVVRATWGQEVPIILLTAIDRPAVAGYEVGANAVVAKPFELDTLLWTIRKHLRTPTDLMSQLLPGAAAAMIPPIAPEVAEPRVLV